MRVRGTELPRLLVRRNETSLLTARKQRVEERMEYARRPWITVRSPELLLFTRNVAVVRLRLDLKRHPGWYSLEVVNWNPPAEFFERDRTLRWG